VPLTLQSNPSQVINVTFTAEFDHQQCKEAVIAAAGPHVLAPDTPLDLFAIFVGEGSGEETRLSCVFEIFFEREKELKKVKGVPIPLVLLTTLEPWQRALERADVARYGSTGHDSITFMPPDEVFRGGAGPGKDPSVNDQKTPFRFVGAILCERYQITAYIQSGGFGRGWEGKDLKTGEKLFIKTFRSASDRAPKRGRLTVEQETKMLASQEGAVRKEIEVLLHPLFRVATQVPEVVSNDLCYGECYVPYTKRRAEMFFIATSDLCDGGELFNYICPTEPPYVRPFTEKTCRRLFRQIATGVGHFHNIGCFHRDLKLENLVLDGKFNCKLMDFGSCKFTDQMEEITDDEGVTRSVTSTYAGIGTRGYKPGDVLSGGAYDPGPFDVWSCGVMLFFMVAGEQIFAELGGRNCFRLFEFMVTKTPDPKFIKYTQLLSPIGERDPVNNCPPHTKFWELFVKLDISDDMKDLFNRIFDVDPKQRIKMEEILDHVWLDEEDDDDEEGFFTEMRSRPTTVSRDQVIKIRGESLEKAVAIAHRAAVIVNTPEGGCPTDGEESCQIHGTRVEVGLLVEGNGESMYSIQVEEVKPGEVYQLRLQWQHGDLGDWLHFARTVKEVLSGKKK
jgi:serine/threonine protein kinase